MRVTLKWKASSDRVQGYHVYRAQGAGSFELLGSTNGLQYADKIPKRGGGCSYYVVAYIGKVLSPASNIVTLLG